LKEVFSLAGRVLKIDIILDKDNKSRGMATVTYETQLEAENAICKLFNISSISRRRHGSVGSAPG